MGAILGVIVTTIVKELVLAADERNAWIARLMGKGASTLPAIEAEEAT